MGVSDLLSLVQEVRKPWCRWVACTNLERLCEHGQRELVHLLGFLGVSVHISDEELFNPLPPLCQGCRSARADVEGICDAAFCTSCRQVLSPRSFIEAVVEEEQERLESFERERAERTGSGDEPF